ncbi:MAG: gliding motility-associated C-terminal domain-containing protein [Bacteroidia bacterium]
MKKLLFACLISFVFVGVKAQDAKTLNEQLSKLKSEGKLNGDESFYNPEGGTKNLILTIPASNRRGSHSNNSTMSSTACNCWIPRDTSFHVVPFDGSGSIGTPPNYANDDGSTNGITLPFNFCLYGNSYGGAGNQLFINNNGNITFGAPYVTFSAVAFPSATYTMVAPFWGDVQTTNPTSGFVYYQLTSTHLIIQWDSVTCYQTGSASAANANLHNTFQLIITDGVDPILSSGNNVSFCYGTMQWTTGDASSPFPSHSGFSNNSSNGSPATVGINKGNGTNYVQVSRFGTNTNVFTNPAGSPQSGVQWLDNQSFYFNACGSSTNLPPLSTSGASNCGADTLNICAVGDSITQSVSFTGPEPTQLVTVTASAPTIGSGFSIVSSTVGTTGTLIFKVLTAGLSVGYYNVSVTGTDNGTPVQSTTVNYVIHVLSTPIPNPILTVNPITTCGTAPAIITLANSSSYDSYSWSTGATTFSTSVAVTTTVNVTVTKNGCSKTGSAVAYIYPNPSVTISGVLSYCAPTTQTNIFANATGGTPAYTYNWDTGASTYSAQVSGSAAPGTVHTVIVSDAHGCTATASVTITSGSVPPINITAVGSLCPAGVGVCTLTSSVPSATSYTWSGGTSIGSTNTYTVNASGVYSLAITINGCTASTTYTLSPAITPTVVATGIMSICSGHSTPITASVTPAGAYSYSWLNGTTSIGAGTTLNIDSTGNYSIVVINNNTQCVGTTSFTVTNYPNPTAVVTDPSNIPGTGNYCKGGSDLLTVVAAGINGPYTYAWLPSSTVATPTASITNVTPAANAGNTTYSVVITDSKGCIDTANIQLKQDNPHLIMPTYSVCPGYTVYATANGSSGQTPYTYTWTTSANSQVFIGKKDVVTGPATYTVNMTDAIGCVITATFNVVENPLPQASFNYAPLSVEAGVPTTFTDASTIATGSVTSDVWTFGDTDSAFVTSPTHIYNNGGTYTVTLVVRSDKGCLDTTYKVIDIQYVVLAPNIITPNGDGINEILAFKNLEYFKNNKLQVFNRWGARLFQDPDYKNNWSGKDLSDGTYFYILEIPEKHKTINGFFESLK